LLQHADTISAVKQFDDLARSSEYVEEKIRKMAESFKKESTQEFIDNQKLMGAAITATKGDMAAIEAQVKSYEKEIQRLIANGISPEDSAVTKPQAELDTLKSRHEENTKAIQSSREAAEGFIKQQKLAAEAVKLTRGPTEALKKSTAAYEKEIQRLITKGLPPQSDHIKALRKEYQQLKQETDKQTGGFKKIGSQLGKLIPNLAGAVAVYKAVESAAREAGQFLTDSLGAYREQEIVMARTKEVLRATGAEAWTTADEIKKMAGAIQDATGRSANEVMAMQDVILGFTSVTDENFERLSKGIINMADIMGGGLIGQANAFGKALDTPAESLGTLTKYGFKFTEQQKEEIKALDAAGERAKAQAIILDSMDAAFGKAAEAARQARGAQVDYNNAMSDLKTAVGEYVAPAQDAMLGFFASAAKGFADSITAKTEFEKAIDKKKAVDSGAEEWGEGWQGQINKAQNEAARLTPVIKNLDKAAADAVIKFGSAPEGLTKQIRDLKSQLLAAENEIRIAEAERGISLEKTRKELEELRKLEAERAAAAVEAAKTMSERLNGINLIPSQNYGDELNTFKSFLNQRVELERVTGAERVAAIAAQEAKILSNLKLTEGQKAALREASLAAQTEARNKAAEEQKKQEAEALQNSLKELGQTEAQEYQTRLETVKRFLSDRLEAQFAAKDAEAEEMKKRAETEGQTAEQAKAAALAQAELVKEKNEYLEEQIALLRELKTLNQNDKDAAEEAGKMLKKIIDAAGEAEKQITEGKWGELEKRKKLEKDNARAIAEIYVEQAQMIMDTFGGAAQSIIGSISQISNGFIQQQQEALNASRESAAEAIKEQYEWMLAEEQYNEEELQTLLDNANAKKLAGEKLTADERKAVEYKMNQELAASEKKFAAEQAALDKKKKEEARNAAIANRALAIAQAPINIAQAILHVLKDFGAPPKAEAIAGIAAASAIGAAQLAALIATPIPSAETGGRFLVPQSFTGVDSALMRVNQGEEVNVTPRGESGGGVIHLIVNIDRRPVIDIIQSAVDSHELIFDGYNI
jgi:hypothetical protein